MTDKLEIVLLGPNGMLGYMLYYCLNKAGFNIISIPRMLFDVSRQPLSILDKYITSKNCVVINCIVHDVTSSDYVQSIAVNSLFPRRLGLYCANRNIKFIHISTNAVFSGKKGSYLENDLPDPTNIYGISKLLGENENCMVLRTSIIGHEQRKKKYLLDWAISQKGGRVDGYINHYWNGITTLKFAHVIQNILDDGLFSEGTYHLYSQEKVSKFKLLAIINDVYQLDLQITPAEEKEYSDRTLSSNYVLSPSLITSSIREQIEEMSVLYSQKHPYGHV